MSKINNRFVNKIMLSVFELTKADKVKIYESMLSTVKFDENLSNDKIACFILDKNFFELFDEWEKIKDNYSKEDIQLLRELIELNYKK